MLYIHYSPLQSSPSDGEQKMERSDSSEPVEAQSGTSEGQIATSTTASTREAPVGAAQGGGGGVASPAPAPPAPVLANVPVQHESATGECLSP